ncbi:MAG: endonuclease, partial [Clostridia bacterium]|nr:endonuclease [Clostridia bacterium]
MKTKFLKTSAVLMALILCVSVLPVFRVAVAAADISYVYDSTGTYIYNWGARGTVATELSPNAKAFYKNQSAYDVLSSYTGGTSKSDAPTSELYLALQKVMKDAHRHQTSYNETRDLYMYTDCQNSGGKISSFYSGKAIGPNWDSGSTWNREHTWPNSKGLGGNDENDIMMLRPTSVSENSSRGSKAYGKSSGYYNPNSTSNNTYDLRGDVARIFLYVYVRWGNVNGNGESGSSGTYTTWGMNGVMESQDVLLEWMEADPVDTWELGRNDSVQTITGTRNVFVDYPEFAFMLFGEEVPDGMTTPSGEGGNACGHNNFDAGVVTPPTCTSKGYTTYTCKTAGCNYSYKDLFVNVIDHDYDGGVCSVCGASDPNMQITYTSEIAVGQPYKLGFFSTDKNDEYFFNGTMSGYYGATDTNHTKAVDVYAEATTGGYHLYFMDADNTKQYINLVASGDHRNFSYATTASSVFVWDDQRDSLYTTVSDEICYMGTYGKYVTMSVLRDSLIKDTDYFARLYVVPTAKQGWKLENGKWYFYEKGVKVVNKWMKDSKGWVYLGSDGAMLTNKWTTDSKGWCYVGV